MSGYSEETRWDLIAGEHDAYLAFATLGAIPELVRTNADGVTDTLTAAKRTSTYRIQYGDTIQSIAKRFNCAESDIVTINKLKVPFVDSYTDPDNAQTYPGVAYRTQDLLVPDPNGTLRPTIRMTDQERINRAFYTDVKAQLTQRSGREYDWMAQDGDLAFETGLNNVIQAAGMRMTRVQGWCLDAPADGFPDEVGKIGDTDELLLAKANILRMIYMDPRIAKVTMLAVDAKDQHMRVRWTAILRTGAQIPETANLVR